MRRGHEQTGYAGVVVGALAAVFAMGCSETDGSTSAASRRRDRAERRQREPRRRRPRGPESFHPQGRGRSITRATTARTRTSLRSRSSPIRRKGDIKDRPSRSSKARSKISRSDREGSPGRARWEGAASSSRSARAPEDQVTEAATDHRRRRDLSRDEVPPEDVVIGESATKERPALAPELPCVEGVHNQTSSVDLADETISRIAR